MFQQECQPKMKTKTFIIIYLVISLLGRASAQELATPKPLMDLSTYSGTYTFNASDTDADAKVNIQFRKNKEKGDGIEWLANGSIRDDIRKQSVTFTGAWVSVEDDGGLIIDAQFLRFKIKGRCLQWPGYPYDLYMDGAEHLEKR